MVINVLMAMMGFIKSYITMKYLDGFYEVGLIGMMQSVIEFVSMLQLGLLSGAFRMYFINTLTVNRRINSMLFSYFGLLLVLTILVSGGVGLWTGRYDLWVLLFLLACAVGVFSLAKTWLSNMLIAAERLPMLNKMNVWSSLLSFGFLLLVPYYGLVGCVLLMISQPVFFILFALWFNPGLRPRQIIFRKNLLRKMWLIGFVPFLAGILVKIDDQAERWGIIKALGFEGLGKYNLVLVYASVFMLIPTSIYPIFYPKMIMQYKENDLEGLKKTLIKFILILFGYALITFIGTALFLPYFINLLLPNYNVGVPYLWYIFPYLLAQILVMPIDLMYNILTKYKMQFISYGFGAALFVGMVIWISNLREVELSYFPIAKSIDGICFLIVSYIGYYLLFVKGKNSIFRK